MTRTLALTLALPILGGCQLLSDLDVKPLEVNGTTLRLQELGWQAAEFTLDVDVTNPHPFALPFGGLDYSFSLDEAAHFAQEFPLDERLAAGDSTTLQVPVTLRYMQVADLVASIARGQRTIPYSGEVGLALDFLGRDRRVAVPLEGEIPVPKPPEIRVEDFDWGVDFPAGLSGTLTLNSAEESERLGPMSALHCDLLINGEPLATLSDPEPLEAGRVSVPWSVSGLRAINSVRQALDSDSRDIRLEGEMVFDAPWGPVRVPLDLAIGR